MLPCTRGIHGIVMTLGLVAALRPTPAGAGDDTPRYTDLDLLRRTRIIAVVGSSASAPGAVAAEAAEVARIFARQLSDSRRVRVVEAERVAAAMGKLQLRVPRDLFTRVPGVGIQLDLDRATRLAKEAGADSLLVPMWDTPPRPATASGPPPRRMHALLVLRVRRQITWEDAELVPTPAASGSADSPQDVSATTERVVGSLVERFLQQWRLAGERG